MYLTRRVVETKRPKDAFGKMLGKGLALPDRHGLP